jgi:hypothetical protein
MILMMRSKKGIKALVTMICMILLVLVFIIFIVLFRQPQKNNVETVRTSFATIQDQLYLQTFLDSPSPFSPRELELDVGSQTSNADVIVKTCSDTASAQLTALVSSADSYFSKIYSRAWRLEIRYYPLTGPITAGVSPVDIKRIGYGGTSDPIVASQMLPCSSGDRIAYIVLTVQEGTKPSLEDFDFSQ